MNASTIIQKLYSHFENYDYRLNNSFVFKHDWESDFFCVSKNGYSVEVEVKISRGDYFADFEKYKHVLLIGLFKKKKFIVVNKGKGTGDKICQFRYKVLVDKNLLWRWDRFSGLSRWDLDEKQVSCYAPASKVRIIDLIKIPLPNQFYYCCPDGLIKPHEVPEYAGLIYCGERIKIVKRAPYLHKRGNDMRTVLLQKFYNLWNYKGLGMIRTIAFLHQQNRDLRNEK